MAFVDTIERMNKQQIESKIDEGQELTPAELRSLFASALAETAPGGFKSKCNICSVH